MTSIRRKAAALMIALIAIFGGVMINATPAQAGSASCSGSLSWNTAYGGCNHYGYASRRMWASCKVTGSHFTFNRSSAWFWGSNICWGTSIGCGTGTRVTGVWFEHGQ